MSMRYELFIDKEKVDLSLSTNINLTYKSNLLSDISKIISNYSYTIKLPATSRNKRIIKGANIVSTNTKFPYIPHSATVICDGIEIIKDANAILLSVSQDAIGIVLSWGNVIPFQKLSEFDGNIGDLELEQSWITWSPTMVYPNIIWAGINYGKKECIYHYCEPVTYLLNKLTDRFGLTIDYPSEKKYILDKLILPTTTTEVPYEDFEVTTANINQIDYVSDDAFFTISIKDIQPITSDFIRGSDGYVSGKYENMSCDIEFNFSLLMQGGTIGTRPNTETIYVIKKGELGEIKPLGTITSSTRVLQEDGWYRYDYSSTVSVENIYGDITFAVVFFFQSINFINPVGEPAFKFYPKPKSEYGEFPKFNRIYINENLPKIKPIDLLKSVCSMLGMFAIPKDSNSIKMESFSSLFNNKSNAVDWSDKVITGIYGDLGEVKFSLDGYVQKNWLRYKEDDTVKVDADAYLLCDNKSLKQEEDMITLPFAATDTVGGMASIPLYSYNDKSELEVSKITDRILLYGEEKNIGTFEGLSWKELISANYREFQEVLINPKIINVSVKLTSVDLSVIDLTKPVYIQQVGSYFAIISIKTNQNNICDVELLKI